jgi:hypothetical protein
MLNEPFDCQSKEAITEMVDESCVPNILGCPFGMRDTGRDELVLDRNKGVLVYKVEEFEKFSIVVERRVWFGSLAMSGSIVTPRQKSVESQPKRDLPPVEIGFVSCLKSHKVVAQNLLTELGYLEVENGGVVEWQT